MSFLSFLTLRLAVVPRGDRHVMIRPRVRVMPTAREGGGGCPDPRMRLKRKILPKKRRLSMCHPWGRNTRVYLMDDDGEKEIVVWFFFFCFF